MTWFSLTGQLRDGRVVTITWQDGQLSGSDPVAVAAVHWFAEQLEGRPVRKLPAAATWHDHLSSPYSAYALIAMGFPDQRPRALELRGEIPLVGEGLPPGAVM